MDKSPKRRKRKDNPYTLTSIEKKNIYIVSFKDVNGIERNVEVNEKIYRAFDRFELDDLSEMNEYDNHIEHSKIYENNINIRAKNKPISLEDEVILKSSLEELKLAINHLPERQRRILFLWYEWKRDCITRKGISKKCIKKSCSCKEKFKNNVKKIKLGGYIFPF